MESSIESGKNTTRGDLFNELPKEDTVKPPYDREQLIWTLKWTHIHLFGINMIFIFMGAVTLFLNINAKLKTWLIALPFVGVLIDIATMWLKTLVSDKFFWLHILGGGLFSLVFVYVSIRALWEMWIASPKLS